MKKLLLLLVLPLLMGFSPKPGQLNTYIDFGMDESNVVGKVVEVDGMRILILVKDRQECPPTTVNLTKDKLECEYYKKQLQKK